MSGYEGGGDRPYRRRPEGDRGGYGGGRPQGGGGYGGNRPQGGGYGRGRQGGRDDRGGGNRDRNRDAYEAREEERGQRWIGVDKYKINSQASRQAEAFDEFRRGLISSGAPASGPVRAAWFGRMAALSEDDAGRRQESDLLLL